MESKPSKVLDACCGSKMFWFDKYDDRVTYVDSRPEGLVIRTKDRSFIRKLRFQDYQKGEKRGWK